MAAGNRAARRRIKPAPLRSGKVRCRTGKVVYPDRAEAQAALTSARRAKGSRRREKRVYPCPVCKRFHLTSKA